MKKLMLCLLVVSAVFGRVRNEETDWHYDQSTFQAFYMFETLQIDGENAQPGQSADVGPGDVVGAFVNGECVGWTYALESYTTLPLMGNDGSDITSGYMVNGQVPDQILIYDLTHGSILELSPADALPGWSNNEIFIINGSSAANNTFGCTDAGACNHNGDATADDGSCWSPSGGCSCDDGEGAAVDCAGVCNGDAALDDCGICNGGNADQDCAGECFGDNSVDGCGVCDSDSSNDDVTCTGCTNDAADNYDESNLFDDGSCTYSIDDVTGLAADAGPARVTLSWNDVDPGDNYGNYDVVYDIYGGLSVDCPETGCGDGYTEDCSGDGDCCPTSWVGDGFADCEEQAYGCDLTCYDNDGGDCDQSGGSEECDSCDYDFTNYGSECCDTAAVEFGIDCATLEANYSWDCSGCECPLDSGASDGCSAGTVEDCSGDGDCAPDSWVGDGWCDGTDQPYGYDLTCYENDGGDCDSRSNENSNDYDAGYQAKFGDLENTGKSHNDVVSTQSPSRSGDCAPDVLLDSTTALYRSILGLVPDASYSFYVVASVDVDGVSVESGASETVSATPTTAEGITWGWDISVTMEDILNPDQHAEDLFNRLGVSPTNTNGFDVDAVNGDVLEPSPFGSEWVSLYFPHPEWGQENDNYTQDIVLERDDWMAHNLTTWDVELLANFPGFATVTFTEFGTPPMGLFYYAVTEDGTYHAISDGSSITLDLFTQDEHATFQVVIGNAPPQSATSLSVSTVAGANHLDLNWTDDSAHNDNYPVHNFNIYRDRADFGGITYVNDGSESSRTDDADLYGDEAGQALLWESSYTYDIVSENPAGTSETVYETWTSGGASDTSVDVATVASGTTRDNNAPSAVVFHAAVSASDDGDTNPDGDYTIPHDGDPDVDTVDVTTSGISSNDGDDGDEIDIYAWSDSFGDLDTAGSGDTNRDSFTSTVGLGYDSNGQDDTATSTHTLTVTSFYPVKSIDEDGYTAAYPSYSNTASIDFVIHEEPNAFPIASSALGLIVEGDAGSVHSMPDFYASDINDYDGGAQVWVVPHDGNPNSDLADLHFEAYDASEGSSDPDGDDLDFNWTLITGADAGFSWDDLDGNGQYNFGEPFSNDGGDHIYGAHDYGDADVSGPGSENIDEEGASGGDLENLSIQRPTDVYILTLTVTDEYGDTDNVSLVVGVSAETNDSPVTSDIRQQGDYVVRHNEDGRNVLIETSVNDPHRDDCAGDGLGAGDADVDHLVYDWSYSGAGCGGDCGGDAGGTDEGNDAADGDWGEISAYLAVGSHEFCFTATDNYGASDTSCTSFTILDEPGAPAPSITIDYVDLRYVELHVNEGSLVEGDADSCHGLYYDGTLHNTGHISLSASDGQGADYPDSDGVDSGNLYYLHDSLTPGATYSYTATAVNSNGAGAASGDNGATTDPAPTVTITNPTGVEEIWATAPNTYTVSFIVTNADDVSDIVVTHHRGDGSSTVEAESHTTANSGGVGGHNHDNSYVVDVTGSEVDYHSTITVDITDEGDYNGGNQGGDSSTSGEFTVADHTISHDFDHGWHIFGAPLVTDSPNNEAGGGGSDLVTNLDAGFGPGDNDLGWYRAYDADRNYEGLNLNLGQGFQLVVGVGDDDGASTLALQGDPVEGSADVSFGIDLEEGWNLIANPLVTYQNQDDLSFTDSSGETKSYKAAYWAGWIQPDILSFFQDHFSAYEDIIPWRGYWIHSSRSLEVTFEPAEFDYSELGKAKTNWVSAREGLESRYDSPWSMIIEASADGLRDFVLVGLSDEASSSFVYGEDQYKLIDDNMISMTVDNEFATNIKGSDYDSYTSWSLGFNNVDGNSIELNVDYTDTVEDIHLVVNDEAVDLKSGSVTVNPSDDVVVVVGNVSDYMTPEHFRVGAAYPNPFNPTTSFEVDLHDNLDVSVMVYNVLGQQVAELANGPMEAGRYTMTWDASSVSSGVYFINVDTDSDISTQKIMLLK